MRWREGSSGRYVLLLLLTKIDNFGLLESPQLNMFRRKDFRGVRVEVGGIPGRERWRSRRSGEITISDSSRSAPW